METTIEPINRVALQIGAIQIYWYGIIIAFGALLGLWIAIRETRRRGLPKDTFVDLVLFAVPISIICARAYYVIFKWEYYSEHPGEIIAIWEGGIAIHGALIGAVLTAVVFSKVRGVSFWKLADIGAPSIILGQAIGRWGNFINQEAFGGEVTRAFLENLYLPDFIINQMYIGGAYHHPAFLYESLLNILGFVLLMLLRKANLRRGELFLTYVIYYSVVRFFIEFFRTDALMLTEQLRMAQVISIALVVLSLVLIWYRRKKGYADNRYLDDSTHV